jgi:glutathione S-transferase
MVSNGDAHPDSNVHPEATGKATATVKAHADSQPLKLYGAWFCPFVQRAWLVLEEKKIPYQYIEVNPYHKPKSLLDLNSRGLVPSLQYDNKPLFESNVICEFLEEAYPDYGTALLPKDPYDRARARIWIDFVSTRIIPAFHRFLQFQPLSDTKGLDEERQEYLKYLKEFTNEMDSEGPYFSGKEIGLVDIVLAPWVVRDWIFDDFKHGLGIPAEGQGRDDEKVWGRYRKWLSAIGQRKSIVETTSDKEHYIPIYKRYADDKAQSELAKATRKGRGVP